MMSCQVILTNAWVAVKVACLAALMGHLAIIVYNKENQESTIATTATTQLDKVDFPAVFYICISPSYNETELMNVGYSSTFDYFTGRSKHKKQVFGWSGHTKEGQPFSNASDVQKRIFLDLHAVINQTLLGLIDGDRERYEKHFIPTSSYKLPHPSYPNNCFTLDLTKIQELKGKIVDMVTFSFNPNFFATGVDIRVIDQQKQTKRHYMFSKLNYQGVSIWLEDFNEPKSKTYMVSFKQDVFLEEDKNQHCVIYPTEHFESFEDCDQNYMADLLKNEILLPAWATPEDLSKATNISKGEGLNYKIWKFFFGDIPSPCIDPCTVTSVQSFYTFTEYHSANVEGWSGLPSLVIDLNPEVVVTSHVFPRYGLDLFLSDLGSCSGLWLGLSVTQAVETAVMALLANIRHRFDTQVIISAEN